MLHGALAALDYDRNSGRRAAVATVILAPSFLYGVAVDGPRVAYADASCRVSIWQAGRTVRLGATPCTERTSTGSGLAGLALAGGRALWVTYTGGKHSRVHGLDEESFGADVYGLQISGSSLVAQVGRTLEVRGGVSTRSSAFAGTRRIVVR